MTELTIGRMATLYGLHRSSLYEAIEKGRLSAGLNARHQKVLDLAEMIRVYGEPPSPGPTPNSKNPTGRPRSPDNSALLDELRRQTAVIEQMSQRIEQLEKTLRQLPAPAAKTDAAPDKKPPKSFSDLLKRFEP